MAVEVMSSGDSSETGDKGSNVALTCAYKYTLHQTFCIETSDDPDEHASAPMERKKPETVEQAKARLVREFTDYSKDGRPWRQR